MRRNDMEEIHLSLANGHRRQMVNQIDEYGSEFWADYAEYLTELYEKGPQLIYFQDATITYFRNKAR